MTQEEERKLLNQVLAAFEESEHTRWAWQFFAINALSFGTLAVIALWLFQNPQLMDWSRVASLVAAVIAGSMIGALATWRLLYRNSAFIFHYIDREKVCARLSQLES